MDDTSKMRVIGNSHTITKYDKISNQYDKQDKTNVAVLQEPTFCFPSSDLSLLGNCPPRGVGGQLSILR
jgi:hypothetical protein